jgi:hypothetical protein
VSVQSRALIATLRRGSLRPNDRIAAAGEPAAAVAHMTLMSVLLAAADCQFADVRGDGAVSAGEG